MNYCEIKNADIANGKGVRISLFVSGCEHHCKGCFNHEAWDFDYGKPFTDETLEHLIDLVNKPYIHGLTILGGEPLHPKNQFKVLTILETIKHRLPNKDIWIYTGYTLYELMTSNYFPYVTNSILSLTDVLVDGRFELDKKDISLKYRGSSNQRVIDMRKTTDYNNPVLLEL